VGIIKRIVGSGGEFENKVAVNDLIFQREIAMKNHKWEL